MIPNKKRLITLIGAAALVTFAGVACGDDNDTDATPAPTNTPAAEATGPTSGMDPTGTTGPTGSPAGDVVSTDTGAAELRAGLTALLQEHVYLAGIATDAALTGGDFEAAAGALDDNSVDLADAIESVYGADAGDAFLELWRAHIGFFVDYTQASASGNTAGAEQAQADLDGYGQDFGAFLASANPNLTQDAVASEIETHVASLIAAIDAQIAGDSQAYALLKEAAHHMPMTANVLASAIVMQMPDTFDGATDTGASELRAGLTALLQEHVYLAGIATDAALTGGDFEAAAGALDDNSVDLADAIESVYGADAGDAFLELWRAHIGFFVDYIQASASGNTAGAEQAQADLDGYGQDFGAFLASANPNLTQDAVASEIETHVASLIAAIDAQIAGDSQAYALLKEAAHHMPMTANVLASAIVMQMPENFAAR